MQDGWIKLHRKLTEWEWYTDIPTKVLFLHLILSANHVDKKWRGNEIKRGQLLTGRVKLAEDTGLSQQQVRTALDKLVSTGEVTTKATNSFSIVTICNYNDYQVKDNVSNQQHNQQVTNEQPTDNQRVTTTKNEKKVKNEKKEIELPDFLKDIWPVWRQHRLEIKKKLTPTTEHGQINKLSKLDQSHAIQTVQNSIDNGWCGLFPEKIFIELDKPQSIGDL